MIVKGYLRHLHERCQERGYTLTEVWPCVVKSDSRFVWVDTEHAAYPRKKTIDPETLQERARIATRQYLAMIAGQDATEALKIKKAPAAVGFNAGPGTELKKLLAKIGIKATPTCSCNKRAQVMDEKGVQWCKDNIDTIVGWLREEATKRKLPFVDMAGKMLVKRAISLAEKAEKKRLATEEQKQSQDG